MPRSSDPPIIQAALIQATTAKGVHGGPRCEGERTPTPRPAIGVHRSAGGHGSTSAATRASFFQRKQETLNSSTVWRKLERRQKMKSGRRNETERKCSAMRFGVAALASCAFELAPWLPSSFSQPLCQPQVGLVGKFVFECGSKRHRKTIKGDIETLF